MTDCAQVCAVAANVSWHPILELAVCDPKFGEARATVRAVKSNVNVYAPTSLSK